MIRPSVVNSAAIAMIRWNDVMGRPSQAPNRVRGSAAVAFAVVFAADASGVLSATWSPLVPRRSNRVSVIFTSSYRVVARAAAANASPRAP